MTTDEWVGRTIAGKYRVEALLGKGGMGLVLLARHVKLDEHVAIKVLLPAMLEIAGMTTRFLREAQAASKIKSQHVARVTDVDVLPDGTPYMIMEYLDGLSLASLRRQRGRLEIAEAVGYVLQACDAIAEAHSLGIVHRDLKPANLFLARGREGKETVKVLDFGISKIDAPGDQDTTKTGQMMGSPKYMAPEQMLSMHDVDGRSDIWSLGAILYDFVAGRTPFVAETTPQLCSLVLHGTPTPPRALRSDLPEELEAVILRCLSRDRAQRFATVADLVAALAPFAPEGLAILAPRSTSHSGLHTLVSQGVSQGVLGPPPSSKRSALDAKPATETPKPVADGEKPTEPVPPVHPSVTPSVPATASAHGATVSVWNSAIVERPPSRRPRTFIAGGAAVAAIAVTCALLFRSSRDAPAAVAQATVVTTVSPVTTGLPVVAATAVPTASAEERVPPPAPAVTMAATAATTSPLPAAAASASGPIYRFAKPIKKTAEPEAPAADPFGGRRR